MIFRRNSEVAERASSYWSNNLQSTYTTIYGGNVGLKISREPVLSSKQAALFEGVLASEITRGLRKNGYLQIRGNGQIMKKALMAAGVSSIDSEEIMFIEDNSDIYFYSPGMKKAKRL